VYGNEQKKLGSDASADVESISPAVSILPSQLDCLSKYSPYPSM
jgi:hypothetical protein